MWSVGCILAELLSKRPVFMCRSEDDVLTKVFAMLGCPTQTHCPMYLQLPKFFQQKVKWSHLNDPQLERMYREVGTPPEAIDLLKQMLHIDPTQRLLAREAL